jgi:hypothetical protein
VICNPGVITNQVAWDSADTNLSRKLVFVISVCGTSMVTSQLLKEASILYLIMCVPLIATCRQPNSSGSYLPSKKWAVHATNQTTSKLAVMKCRVPNEVNNMARRLHFPGHAATGQAVQEAQNDAVCRMSWLEDAMCPYQNMVSLLAYYLICYQYTWHVSIIFSNDCPDHLWLQEGCVHQPIHRPGSSTFLKRI